MFELEWYEAEKSARNTTDNSPRLTCYPTVGWEDLYEEKQQ